MKKKSIFGKQVEQLKLIINYFQESKSFNHKKPIKVIDTKLTLLGIGFLNKDQSNINPKLVLNAK